MSVDTAAAQWKVIYDRLDKLSVGDETTYAELQALLPDTLWKGVVAAFHQARKRFAQIGVDFENVRGEGYRKVNVLKTTKAKAAVVKDTVKVEKAASARKTKAPVDAARDITFIAADTAQAAPAKALTQSQRVEALETQVQFLTGRLEELSASVRLKPAPGVTAARRAAARKN